MLANVQVAAKSRYKFDKKRCVWGNLFPRLVPTDDSLKETVYRFGDVTSLLEHGERLVDIVVRRASQAEWTEWLHSSLVLATQAGIVDMLCTLMAVVGDGTAVPAPCLLGTAASGRNETILSVLLDAGAGSALEKVDTQSVASHGDSSHRN